MGHSTGTPAQWWLFSPTDTHQGITEHKQNKTKTDVTRVQFGGEFKLSPTQLNRTFGQSWWNVRNGQLWRFKPLGCALSFTLAYSTPVLSYCLLTNTLRRSNERVRNRLIVSILCCAERGEAVRAVDVRALMISESTPQIVQGRQMLRSSLCLGSFFGRKKKWHSTIMVRPIIVQKWNTQTCFHGFSNRCN